MEHSTKLLSRQKQKTLPTFDYFRFLIWYCFDVKCTWVFFAWLSKMMIIVVLNFKLQYNMLLIERWWRSEQIRGNGDCRIYDAVRNTCTWHLTFSFRRGALFYYVYFFTTF